MAVGVGAVGGHRVVGAEHPPQQPAADRGRHRRGVGRRSPRPAPWPPASTSSAGWTLRTSPPASASWARKTRAVRTHSSAWLMPTTRGRNQLARAVGGDAPAGEHEADLGVVGEDADVHRQRHRDADADGRAVDRADHRLRAVEDAQHEHAAAVARAPSACCPSRPPRRRSRTCRRRRSRSAPAQNARPAPVTITARTASSASAWSNATSSSSSIVPVKALSCSGRFSVMIAAGPSTS